MHPMHACVVSLREHRSKLLEESYRSPRHVHAKDTFSKFCMGVFALLTVNLLFCTDIFVFATAAVCLLSSVVNTSLCHVFLICLSDLAEIAAQLDVAAPRSSQERVLSFCNL